LELIAYPNDLRAHLILVDAEIHAAVDAPLLLADD
jgi:hypothetical protein